MPLLPLGPAGDAFAGVFGGVAAAFLIGGPILLRWQRNRHQFALAQAALAQGVTHFPKGPPFWLLSLRQGISALTLGIGLLVVGGTGAWLTWNIESPAIISTQPVTSNPTAATMPLSLPTPADVEPLGPGRSAPPQPNPAMEEWHRLKAINTLSLMSVSTGFVLALLGIVRIAFAKTERHHDREDELS
jgi:hypothetical protein